MPTIPAQVSPPEFAVTDAQPSRVVGAAAVAVPVLRGDDGPVLGPGSAELLEDTGLDLLGLLEDSHAKAGEVYALPVAGRGEQTNPMLTRVLMVGVGDATTADVRRAAAALARHTHGLASVASSIHCVGDDDTLVAFVEGIVLGSFRFSMRSKEDRPAPVARVVLAGCPEGSEAVLARGLALAGAGWRSRFLATVPSNVKSPQWMVEQALSGAEAAGLRTKVWDEAQLAKQGFGGLTGVGQASATPPRLVQLSYAPAKGARSAPHIVLVGKGITFDSGGLSIKPGESMKTMKRDMTGAGVVLAVLEACQALEVPVRVTGLLALAENAVSGAALRPGDVISHYGGRTTEVLHTDAEGRLVLADALAYAAAELKPDALVDVATLTGAIKVALGTDLAGLFTNRESLAETLTAAGAAAGEPLWRMPLAEEYAEKLSSKLADQNNAPNAAPSITAALFLKAFTADLPWAHLDIASFGDAPKDNGEWTEGPTGFGPRLLLRWLADEPARGQ